MFNGTAEEALRFYVSLFRDSEVTKVDRYGPGEPGKEGSVRKAEFRLGTQSFACIDSPVKHAFTFTPSFSIFVECESEPELDAAFDQLSANGTVLMALGNYGFSRKFGWLNDRFGVSWQLNLR
jgi:predicted 3-demethylubiquinone-9 3-methyltransferase (glyoxalase superfamily)